MKNKYKFIAVVTCLFLVPFLILSRHFLYGNKELHKSNTLRYLELRTLSSSRMVAEVLNSRYSLAAVAADPKFRTGGAGRKSLLERKVSESPVIYSEIALLGASGKEIAKASAEKKSAARFDYSKTKVFAAAKRTAMPAGAVEYGEYTPPALVLAEPVRGSGGKTEYFLTGRLSLAYLGELVRLMGRNSYGNMGLIDAGGQIILDSASMTAIRPGMKAPEEISGVIASAVSGNVRNLAGEVKGKKRSYLVSVSNVPGSGWWFYEVMDVAMMPAYKAPFRAGKIVFSGVVLNLIFGVLAYFLALRWLPVRLEDEAVQ